MASSTSTTAASVAALKKTHDALLQIQTRLKPFLENATTATASNSNDDSTTNSTTTSQRALSQAAVALSIATMRVVGARLQGLDRGRKADDPLRQELNRIRTALVSAQQKLRREEKEEEEQQQQKQRKQTQQPAHVQTKTSTQQLTPSDDTATNDPTSTAPSKRKHQATSSDQVKGKMDAKRARNEQRKK